MRCPSCNHDNSTDALFCEECGTRLELICPTCKVSVSPGARYCKKCGTAIGTGKAAASTTVSSTKSEIIVAADGPASGAIEGERKTVTALFADIKGSTELMRDLDPEEARALVALSAEFVDIDEASVATVVPLTEAGAPNNAKIPSPVDCTT